MPLGLSGLAKPIVWLPAAREAMPRQAENGVGGKVARIVIWRRSGPQHFPKPVDGPAQPILQGHDRGPARSAALACEMSGCLTRGTSIGRSTSGMGDFDPASDRMRRASSSVEISWGLPRLIGPSQ